MPTVPNTEKMKIQFLLTFHPSNSVTNNFLRGSEKKIWFGISHIFFLKKLSEDDSNNNSFHCTSPKWAYNWCFFPQSNAKIYAVFIFWPLSRQLICHIGKGNIYIFWGAENNGISGHQLTFLAFYAWFCLQVCSTKYVFLLYTNLSLANLLVIKDIMTILLLLWMALLLLWIWLLHKLLALVHVKKT